MLPISTVYVITCLINDKKYVGFTKHKPITRWQEHKRHHLKSKKPLYRAMRKHGIEHFSFEVIYQSLDHDHTKNVMEGHFIRSLNTHISTLSGYNVTHGGEGNGVQRFGSDNPFYGRKHSHETREAISAKAKGRQPTDEQKDHMRLAQIGRKHSQITKQKMSKAQEKGPYMLTNPDGECFVTENLQTFGEKHGLNGCELGRVCNGKYKHHRGWKAERIAILRRQDHQE